MKNVLNFHFALFVFLIISSVSTAQLSGKTYITSDCASGGFDYYFLDEGELISICSGCEAIPYIQYGTYKVSGSVVEVSIIEEWYGQGEGDVIFASSINHYERYSAKWGQSTEQFTIPYQYFTTGNAESCESIGEHEFEGYVPHDFLRNELVGRYPKTAYQLLTHSDLKGKSKQELRLMRNEIYARYGYIFGSEDLKAHFEQQAGYSEFSKDVEAFLSETEKKNVKFIQSYEKK